MHVVAPAAGRTLNEIATRRGQSLAQMALAWTLRGLASPPRWSRASSVGQLKQNIAAHDQDADELAEIELSVAKQP